MARHDPLDDELLRSLAAYTSDPVITLAMPTHRWGPDLAQDEVTLRRTIEQLASSPQLAVWPQGPGALHRLQDEANQVDLQHAADTLLLYAGAERSGHLMLDGEVGTRVAIGKRIALTPVVRAHRFRFPALVVSVTEYGGRAWHKVGLRLDEVHDDHFPFDLEPALARREDRRAFGRQPSTLEATQRTRLAHELDRRIDGLLDGRHLPVYLAGTPKATAAVTSNSRLHGRLASLDLGVLGRPTAADLASVAQKVHDDLLAAWARRRCADLVTAVGGRRIAVDLDEITELVHDGNAATLLLDDHHLTGGDEAHAMRLDHVVATMLARGDQVDVVPSIALRDLGPTALITRY